MRSVLALLLAMTVLAVPAPAHADPEVCPPICNSIPTSAWIDPASIPLNDVYRWPPLHRSDALTDGRFRFEELCGSPSSIGDPRSYAVRSTTVVDNGADQWHLHAQVLHWRGDTLTGGATARALVDAASDTARACQEIAPELSPSITVDEPGRLALVTSGSVILHQYLIAHPDSSSVSELALWTSTPTEVNWPVVSDDEVFADLTTPLCTAYVSSCR